MQNNSELQNTINRIQRMEQYLDEVLNVMRNKPSFITTDVTICEKIDALTQYYENGQWLQDYDCDASGELPEDLKRGVLAQDTLYDLLCEIDELEVEQKMSMSDICERSSNFINIYLLRHGETDWNQTGCLQGHTDIPLNQSGKIQMSHAAEVLANICPDMDLVISSPLSRAYESAEIVADRLAYEKEEIVVEPLLIERCFGVGEGLTIDERAEKYPDNNYPDMEPYEELIERARSAFEKIVISFGSQQNILLVAHGAILYAMVTAITNGQISYGGPMLRFDQGSIQRIRYTDGRVEVARYSENDSAFIRVEYK